MVKNLKVEEVMMLDSVIGNIIGKGIPVLKQELLDAKVLLAEVTETTLTAKQTLVDKYITRNEDGTGILKDDVDMSKPLMVTDFVSTDEEAMVKEIEALTAQDIEIEFETVSKGKEILVKVDGEYKTFTLQKYLEMSTEIDSRTLGLINEFFIND